MLTGEVKLWIFFHSIHQWCHPHRGRGNLPKGDVTVSKIGDNGGGRGQKSKKWVMSFMDAPLSKNQLFSSNNLFSLKVKNAL